jgi:hypothetical protein
MLEHACGQKEIQSTRPYLSTRKPTQSRDPEMWSFKMKSAQDTLTHRHTHTPAHTHMHTRRHFFSLSLCIVAAAWPKAVKPRLDHSEAQRA